MPLRLLPLPLVLFALTAHAADPELARLSGKWQIARMEMAGSTLTSDQIPAFKLAVTEIDGNRVTARMGDRLIHEGTIRIDASSRPKTIQGKLMAGPVPGASEQPSVGIYEVQGDTLWVCFAPGGPTPREFRAGGPSGAILVTYRRIR